MTTIKPTIGELKFVFPGFDVNIGKMTYKGYDIIENEYGHFNIRLNGEGINCWYSNLSETLKIINRLDGQPEKEGVNICGGW